MSSETRPASEFSKSVAVSEEIMSRASAKIFWFKELAEGTFAFVGLAYACGFITVMVHTFMLGAPVIELAQPIYVWVGLPVAIAIIPVRVLIRFFLQAHYARKQSRKTGSVPERGEGLTDTQLAEKFLKFYDQAKQNWMTRFAANQMCSRQLRLLKDRDIKNLELSREDRRILVESFVFNPGQPTYGGAAYITGLWIILLCIYVLLLYPSIPQGLGGGAARTVQLVITSERLNFNNDLTRELFGIDEELERLLAPRGIPYNPKPRPSVTSDLTLLYSTKDLYLIQTKGKNVLTISSESIDAVAWK